MNATELRAYVSEMTHAINAQRHALNHFSYEIMAGGISVADAAALDMELEEKVRRTYEIVGRFHRSIPGFSVDPGTIFQKPPLAKFPGGPGETAETSKTT